MHVIIDMSSLIPLSYSFFFFGRFVPLDYFLLYLFIKFIFLPISFPFIIFFRFHYLFLSYSSLFEPPYFFFTNMLSPSLLLSAVIHFLVPFFFFSYFSFSLDYLIHLSFLHGILYHNKERQHN